MSVEGLATHIIKYHKWGSLRDAQAIISAWEESARESYNTSLEEHIFQVILVNHDRDHREHHRWGYPKTFHLHKGGVKK